MTKRKNILIITLNMINQIVSMNKNSFYDPCFSTNFSNQRTCLHITQYSLYADYDKTDSEIEPLSPVSTLQYVSPESKSLEDINNLILASPSEQIYQEDTRNHTQPSTKSKKMNAALQSNNNKNLKIKKNKQASLNNIESDTKCINKKKTNGISSAVKPTWSNIVQFIKKK